MPRILSSQGVLGLKIPILSVTRPPPSPFLLQEDGVSKIILEDGSGFLLLES